MASFRELCLQIIAERGYAATYALETIDDEQPKLIGGRFVEEHIRQIAGYMPVLAEGVKAMRCMNSSYTSNLLLIDSEMTRRIEKRLAEDGNLDFERVSTTRYMEKTP